MWMEFLVEAARPVGHALLAYGLHHGSVGLDYVMVAGGLPIRVHPGRRAIGVVAMMSAARCDAGPLSRCSAPTIRAYPSAAHNDGIWELGTVSAPARLWRRRFISPLKAAVLVVQEPYLAA